MSRFYGVLSFIMVLATNFYIQRIDKNKKYFLNLFNLEVEWEIWVLIKYLYKWILKEVIFTNSDWGGKWCLFASELKGHLFIRMLGFALKNLIENKNVQEFFVGFEKMI